MTHAAARNGSVYASGSLLSVENLSVADVAEILTMTSRLERMVGRRVLFSISGSPSTSE